MRQSRGNSRQALQRDMLERMAATVEAVDDAQSPAFAVGTRDENIRVLEEGLGIQTRLLDNSLEAVEPGGRVSLELEETQAGVALKVVDTGRGIDPDDMLDAHEARVERRPVIPNAPDRRPAGRRGPHRRRRGRAG